MTLDDLYYPINLKNKPANANLLLLACSKKGIRPRKLRRAYSNKKKLKKMISKLRS